MEKIEKQNGSIELLAYRKIIYHCIRYSSLKVYGALIAQKTDLHKITDAYPLFHSPITNPTFGIALDLIESNLKPTQKIVGFYEFIDGGDSSINRIIQTNSTSKDSALKEMKNLRLWMVDSSEIKFGISGLDLKYPSFNQVRSEILKGQHNYIVDFDAHFEQIELDFTNSYVK